LLDWHKEAVKLLGGNSAKANVHVKHEGTTHWFLKLELSFAGCIAGAMDS
jgi:hypothetical protein